jgi:hypothetical protein
MKYIEVKDWTSDHCIQWLANQGLTSLIPMFLERNIHGDKLLALDSNKMKVRNNTEQHTVDLCIFKAMGIKSSHDRDQLKIKLKQLKHVDLDRTRQRLLAQPQTSIERFNAKVNRFRSSSLTKLKDRRLFSSHMNTSKS